MITATIAYGPSQVFDQQSQVTHVLFAMALAGAQGLPWPMVCRSVVGFNAPGQATQADFVPPSD